MTTLRTRVATVTTLVVALAFLVTGLLVVGSTRGDARRRLDTDLDRRLALLTAAVPGERGGQDQRPGGGRPPVDLRGEDGADGPAGDALRQVAQRSLGQGYFGVVGTDTGEPLIVVGDVPASLPSDPTDTLLQYTDDGGRVWRVRSVAISRGDDVIVVRIGADLSAAIDEPIAELVRRLAVLGSVAALLTGAVTAGVVGVATRPLRRLRDATTQVSETQDLTTRVDLAGAPREIGEVAEGLNTMLERLQVSAAAQAAALHGAQRFAADAGHELRTPLTAMQADLEALVRNPDAEPALRQEALTEVADETRRLSGLLASLQALARADSGAMPPAEHVDLTDLVSTAVQAATTRFPDVQFSGPGDEENLVVRGSEPWLRSVVDNLLGNAALHGRPDGQVSVGVHAEGRTVRIIVDDDGPGIPVGQREAVFSRFVRGADAHDRPGSGLGLSLVAQLVALHGGTVGVDDSPLGGAQVAVTLPAA